MDGKCMNMKEGTIDGLGAEEWSLVGRIPDVERVKAYIRELARCHRLDEVISRVICPMILTEPTVTIELVSSKEFYNVLLPLMKNVERGKSLTAWRNHIFDFAQRVKKCQRMKER